LNADTKAGEGEFYAWHYQDINKLVKETIPLLPAYFNISPTGNWKANQNILYATYTPDEFARVNNINPEHFSDRLMNARKILFQERNKRDKPEIDKKIITSWNALALKGFIDAYAAFGEEAYLKQALINATYIEKNLLDNDGQLWRCYHDGKLSTPGFLEDYALLSSAYIRLYEVSLDKRWLITAERLVRYAIHNFYDNAKGLFYYSSAKSEKLVVRRIEFSDNDLPSSNAVMSEVLHHLGVYFDNHEYSTKAAMMLSRASAQVNSRPENHTAWCYVAGIFSYGTHEVAIMGKNARKINLDLQKNYLPHCIFMGETNKENLPLLQNKMQANKTLIYVCTNKVCKLPVEETSLALQQLNK
jgi:uncharacterized protein YyaL (SSP411 family)